MASEWEPVVQDLTTSRYPRLLARARMLSVSDDEAADLVQEALIATFSRPRHFDSIAQAEQYVRRAIVTKYCDAAGKSLRERERWLRAAQGQPNHLPDPAAAVAGAVDVEAALQTLPARVRACIALRFLEDMSIRETADQLGLSTGAVKRYVSDGLALLNARLGTTVELDQLDRVEVQTRKGGTR